MEWTKKDTFWAIVTVVCIIITAVGLHLKFEEEIMDNKIINSTGLQFEDKRLCVEGTYIHLQGFYYYAKIYNTSLNCEEIKKHNRETIYGDYISPEKSSDKLIGGAIFSFITNKTNYEIEILNTTLIRVTKFEKNLHWV